ncbi:DUF11 domain-containing protein, partial [Phaeodactylibacter luteus]
MKNFTHRSAAIPSHFGTAKGYLSLAFLCLLLGLSTLQAQVMPPNIEWDKTVGGDDEDFLSSVTQTADGGYILAGYSNSNISGDKSEPTDGFSDYWVVKLDASGAFEWENTIGGDGLDLLETVAATADGGCILGGYSNSSASGDKSQDAINGNLDYWVVKLDALGVIEWDKIIGGTDGDVLKAIVQTADGGYVLGGESISNASGDKSQDAFDSSGDYWVVKLDALGNVQWDNTLGGDDTEVFKSVQQTADGGYILGGYSASDASGDKSEDSQGNLDYWVVKLDAQGAMEWENTIGGSESDALETVIQTADGGYLVGGSSKSPVSGDKTEPNYGFDDYWVVKLDAQGTIEWQNTLEGDRQDDLLAVAQTGDGGYLLFGHSNTNIFGDKSENTKGVTGFDDYWVVKLDALGTTIEWDKTIGGDNGDFLQAVAQTADGGFILGGYSGSSISGDKSEDNRGSGFFSPDYWVVKLECQSSTAAVTNDISPATQTACQLGSPQVIMGTDDDAIYQDPITYQWQISTDNVSWTDIAGATGKDFLPEPALADRYFRRIANWNCQQSDTSNVHTLLISGGTAPTVDAGGVFYTCPSSPVTLGGAPTASGGTGPYTYTWDMAGALNDPAIANPVATVAGQTIFTLEVIDNAGCRKIDQAVVIPYEADAGADVQLCAGGPGAQIGTTPPQGLAATYSWSPATGLSDANIAQPIATPGATTTYTLSVTYTNADGLACTTTDAVEVTFTGPPPTPNFAGPDQVLCAGNPTTTTLGTPADPGYTYTWAPGKYLETNNAAEVTFNSGDEFPTVPDPITYQLTAEQNGCTFTDDVELTVIRSFAGLDGCGPRFIGTPDQTPYIAETYTWTLLSSVNGNTGFLGSTTDPVVPVGPAGAGGLDVYQLEVSFGGTTCVSTVEVPECACGVVIERARDGNCPLFDGSNIRLLATAGPGAANDFTYTWSPADGLSATTGREVFLTDGVNRTYTVTATSTIDPSFTCSGTIEVNNPAWSYPDFPVSDDEACSGTLLNIGLPPVAGYSYAWSGPDAFTSTDSDPQITVSSASSGTYSVTVTEDVSGCFSVVQKDVTAQGPVANAGPDYTACSNAVITLGTPDNSGGANTFAWEPAASPWQNGTDETSPQPQILLATTVTFTLTVTDPQGCTNTDEATVTIDNNPTIADAPDQDICLGDEVQIGSPALPGVTYSWSPTTGLSNPNIAQPLASPTGTTAYTVTATFPGNCNLDPTDAVTVTVFDPAFDLGADLSSCPTGAGVSIGANAPSTGVAQYIWSPLTGLDDGTIQNPTANPSVATTYSLRVIYTNGCEFTDQITVSPESEPEAGFNRTICLGETTTIGSASNTGTIAWTGDTGPLSSTSAAAPVFDSNISGPGTFNLTLTMTVGTCTTTDDIQIIVTAPPSISPVSASVCTGGCAQIGLTPQAGFTYSWYPATDLSSATVANPTVCPTASRTYQLTATSLATGCSVTEEVTVKVLPATAPTVTVDPVLACVGTSFTFNTNVSPAGSYSFLWTPATGLSSPFVEDPSGIANTTTTYTVQVTDNTTGCASEAEALVEVQSGFSSLISTQPVPITVCDLPISTTANFSITNNNSGTFTYQWQENKFIGWQDLTDDATYSGTNTTSLTINSPGGLEAADYRVVVTQTDGCGTSETSTAVSLDVENCNCPLAGDDNSDSFTAGSGAGYDLTALLSGADAGGTWAQTGGDAVDISNPANVDFSASAPGVYTFTYTHAASGTCLEDQAVFTITINAPQIDLGITKTVDNNMPNFGDNVVFTLTVTNHGPSDATGVQVDDLLSAGFTYSSDNSGGSYTPGTGVWTIGNLNNGQSVSLQITAAADQVGSYLNQATVSLDQPDYFLPNNEAEVEVFPVFPTVVTNTTCPEETADLTTINIENQPAGTTVTYHSSLPVSTGNEVADPTMVPSGIYYIAFYDPVAMCFSGATQVTVDELICYADLQIFKTVDNPMPDVATNVVFTLQVINNGPDLATGVFVTDNLPSGYSYVSDDGGGAYNSGTGRWTIGNLANGATATLNITATVNTTGDYLNTATVFGDQNDLLPGNNTDDEATSPNQISDITTVKTNGTNTYVPGTTVPYTITVTNNG